MVHLGSLVTLFALVCTVGAVSVMQGMQAKQEASASQADDMIRLDTNKVDANAYFKRALNLGESNYTITCDSAADIQCPAGSWERVVAFDNETLSRGDLTVSVSMIECFCNSKAEPKSCCGADNEVYTASFCGKQMTSTGNSDSDEFISAQLYQDWITGSFANRRSFSATEIATGDTWKESCPARLGEAAQSRMASESCEISDGYEMFSESQANAFIQSVSKLLPQTSNTNGTVNTDVNGTVIDMAISMDIDTCNTTTNEVCAVQADVKGAWAPQGSSAVTCVNVREKQYSSCGCLNAGVSLAGEIALRDAISSARAKFVVDANAAFEQLVVAQKVATHPDVVSTIQTEYQDQVAEATEELLADTGQLEELKEQNERMMKEFTELLRGKQDSADEAAKDILEEAFDDIFKDDDMETLLPKLSFSLCTFVQTLMAPEDVKQFPEGSVAEHAQNVVRESLSTELANWHQNGYITQMAVYFGEVTNALDQLTGQESPDSSLLCTIQRKQNQADEADGYVCFPTKHAIQKNKLLSTVKNPAYYITQLLQAGSFPGIKGSIESIAKSAKSQKMDYCTMDRPALQSLAKANGSEDESEDESDDDVEANAK